MSVWSLCLVCLLVAFVSPAKNKRIEMPFALVTRVDRRNHVLDGGPDPPRAMGNFWGLYGPLKSTVESVLRCTQQKNQ